MMLLELENGSAPDALPGKPVPTKPKPGTRMAGILEALKRGEKLTQIDALNRGYGWRLAAHIFALKEYHGWSIEKTDIYRQKGNPIAQYSMPAGS
jgi:hypothetical protein